MARRKTLRSKRSRKNQTPRRSLRTKRKNTYKRKSIYKKKRKRSQNKIGGAGDEDKMKAAKKKKAREKAREKVKADLQAGMEVSVQRANDRKTQGNDLEWVVGDDMTRLEGMMGDDSRSGDD